MDFLDERMSLPIQGVSINWDRTHSPILLGIPGAEILSFDDGQIHPIDYEDTESYQITRMFVENKEQLLRRLLSDDGVDS